MPEAQPEACLKRSHLDCVDFAGHRSTFCSLSPNDFFFFFSFSFFSVILAKNSKFKVGHMVGHRVGLAQDFHTPAVSRVFGRFFLCVCFFGGGLLRSLRPFTS